MQKTEAWRRDSFLLHVLFLLFVWVAYLIQILVYFVYVFDVLALVCDVIKGGTRFLEKVVVVCMCSTDYCHCRRYALF